MWKHLYFSIKTKPNPTLCKAAYRITCTAFYTTDAHIIIWGHFSNKHQNESELNVLLVLLSVDVEPQRVDSQPQVCALLVLDLKIVDAEHLEVLSDLQVFNHGLFPDRISAERHWNVDIQLIKYLLLLVLKF